MIIRKAGAAALLAVGLVAGSATLASAEVLGCRVVNLAVDRDVIPVSRADGRFSAIQLHIAGTAIEIFDLKVVYGNGAPDDLAVRSVIPAGGQTRWIDLKGRQRFIRQVELVYRSIPTFRGRAEVCVHGR